MQSSIRVSCPHCAFCRDLPGDKVPDRPVRVTCPRCKQAFDFQKPASPPPPPAGPALPPQEQPPVPPEGGTPRIAPLRQGTGPLPARKPSTSTSTSTGRRPLLLGLILLAVIVVAMVYGGFAGSLLSRLNRAVTPGRQVITIPPPAGELPAMPPQGGGAGGASLPPAGTSPPPAVEIGPAPGPAASGGPLRATDLSVFIYAVNAPGTIRVNGHEFKVIKSEPDMQYNINTFGEQFKAGGNTIEFDVTPRPGDGRRLSPELHMKVSRDARVLGEWRLSDREGWPRSVTIDIPGGNAP
jgi:hypothetical protein